MYNEVCSEHKTVCCGVPQGSILGPLLFLLYVNNLANISDKLKFILFADDTNVFYSSKELNDVTRVFNEELIHMSIWFKVNKLSLNLSKTNYMIFGSGVNESVYLSIDGVNIERVTVTKFLGVQVDEKLSWKEQINSVYRNVSKGLSILYKVRNILESKLLYTLYCSLILPYFNYACEIWGNTFDSHINKLILLQKRIIRVIDKADYRDHTNPLFVKYNCLKFKDIVNLKTLVVVFKAKHNLLPFNVQKLFTENHCIHTYNTRSSSKGNFITKYCRTKLRSMNVSFRGIKLWNELDESFHNISSIASFKKKTKHLF